MPVDEYGPREPDHDSLLRRAFYDALKEAALGTFGRRTIQLTVHDLRHSFGTLGASIWPLHDLQAYLGHADVQTTMIYVHHVPSAADELSRAVAAAMSAETMTRTVTRTPEFAGNSEQVEEPIRA